MGCFDWALQLLLLLVWAAVPSTGSPESPAFSIQSEQSNKCLKSADSGLSLTDCSKGDESLLWKWGSNHRLFNLGSQKCLGLGVSTSQDPLQMFACDSKHMLWWRCHGGHIYGASMYGLAENNGSVTATYASNDTWRRGGSAESVCHVPYHVIYTTDGNSHGERCEFPFYHDGKWHHDCITDVNRTGEWCATTADYASDRKWGLCLKPVNGCADGWTENATLRTCYQFNARSSLKWQEAYQSCRSQGADLLSIANAEELAYITANDDLPDMMWIGLNRFDSSGGWQWSDDTPLNFINWNPDGGGFSRLDDSDCGLLKVETGRWQKQHCSLSLPYVCKKYMNGTKSKSPDNWPYLETQCDSNWIPNNGFCYKLQQPSVWEDAERLCKTENSTLISLHSLADIEMAVTAFGNESGDMWSGFRSEDFPPLFTWSDGEETRFTYWDQNEPIIPSNSTSNCVSFSRTSGRWRVQRCNKTLASICKKTGAVTNNTASDHGCPQDLNWRRHGDFCYLIYKDEVPFGAKCNLTVTSRFEQEFINSLIREQNPIERAYFWTGLRGEDLSLDYYWQTSEGKKDLTFSNWNALEPAFPGGCVAMATGQHLGKWEVKNCKAFKAQSICKKSIGSPKPEDAPKPSGSCPEEWEAGSGSQCYKLFHYKRLHRTRTWEEAEGICEEFGAHLAGFSHKEEMDSLYSFLKSMGSYGRWIWVGLNKRNMALHGSWEWSDGRPVSSVVFPDDFQEEDYDLRDCAAFKVNRPTRASIWRLWFNDKRDAEYYMKPFHCDAALEFVCQIPKGAVLKTPEWYVTDWNNTQGSSVMFEDYEYLIVHEKHLNYKEADLYCTSVEGELASIDSYGLRKAIESKMLDEMKFNQFQMWWVKSINYRSQQERALHRFLGMQFSHCPFMTLQRTSTDRFQFADCNKEMPFICEKHPLSWENNRTKTSLLNGSCPQNWIEFRDKCFLQVNPEDLTFLKANEKCETFGGTLPTITSQLEQDFITYLLPNMTSKFWIGLKLTLDSVVSKWIDSREVSYVNFHPLLQGRLKKFSLDPFEEERNKQCLFILNDPNSTFAGTWDFTSCAETQYVSLCQRYKDTNGSQTPATVADEVEFHGYRYKIIQSNLTWYQALSQCHQHNMSLVSITDQYQLSFLAVQAALLSRPMWIGLSSIYDGVHYRWQNGKQVTINRWSEEDEGSEECVYMSEDGFWKTEDCDTMLPGAFCYSAPEDVEQTPAENTKLCPHRIKDTPWIPFRNSCYTFLVSHKRWLSIDTQESRHVCRALHPDAYVLNIRDEAENDFVFNQLKPFRDLAKWVWLGVVYDGREKRLRWHDQTFIKYSNWRSGRPEVSNNSFYSAMNIDGFWDMYTNLQGLQVLYLQHHSIVACKIDLESPEHYNKSLPDIIHHENMSYHVIPKKLSWMEAVRECRLNGSHVASVHSEIQQGFLEYIVKQEGFPLWIGLSNHDGGLSDYEWSDGSPYDYVEPEFSQLNPAGSCVYLDTKGFWRSKNCTDTADGAICYRSASQKIQDIKYPVCSDTPGPGQWLLRNNFCYGFDLKIYNFSVFSSEEASTLCHNLDPTSTLLTIDSAEENDFVAKYLKADPFITNRVWLGLSASSSATDLKWQDGSPAGYTNWSGAQKEAGGPCGVLLPADGVWHRVSCTSGHARVVCKAPLLFMGVNSGEAGEGGPMKAVLLLLCLWSAAFCAAGHSEPGLHSDECPSSIWVQFQNNCYTFIYATPRAVLSIEPARELCKAAGSDIISINTEEENKFLLQMFKTEWNGPKEILLGLFYDSDDDSLKWYDKSEVTFKNWREADETDKNLISCVKMNTFSGLWDLISCDNFVEIGTLCKTKANKQKEKQQTDQSALLIGLIASIILLVPTISIIIILYKRRVLSTIRNLPLASQVNPYRDEIGLVDTMEEDST
ncbi:lymphocyte antigen 75 [Spea bombifrons]|uniref:lymphocyte antigen 75 n=1 Tax=Spea bombifrons TaxID=233779 RepID=UPI002348EF6B|nr:lymphocyte antigen 75 [Spea bombifrons]